MAWALHPVADELTFLGVILDRKLITWASRIEACTKQLAVAMTSCARAKWGLGRRVVKQIYKGAVEPIMHNGVAAWAASLTKQGTARRLRSVQRLAALAMTGCFRMTLTSAVLALAGLLCTGEDACWEGAGTAVLPWPPVQEIGDHPHPVQVVATPVARLVAGAVGRNRSGLELRAARTDPRDGQPALLGGGPRGTGH